MSTILNQVFIWSSPNSGPDIEDISAELLKLNLQTR